MMTTKNYNSTTGLSDSSRLIYVISYLTSLLEFDWIPQAYPVYNLPTFSGWLQPSFPN